MKSKKQFAQNKLFNLLFCFFILLVWLAVAFFLQQETGWGIGVGAVAFIISVPLVFTPIYYKFDIEGISLHYIFLPEERYLWDDIYAIEVENVHFGRSSWLDFFYSSVFSLKGKNTRKKLFYMQGHIRKSFRTKYLLESYWDGTITGYMFEDTKKWLKKRRGEKEKYINSHLTDEIVPMEREVRAQTRELLKNLAAQVNQYNLEIRTNYFFVTKNSEKLKSRPQEAYTYVLDVEISNFNEKADECIATLSIDLLYVRIGKKGYRGVKNPHINDEFNFSIFDVLAVVNKS